MKIRKKTGIAVFSIMVSCVGILILLVVSFEKIEDLSIKREGVRRRWKPE